MKEVLGNLDRDTMAKACAVSDPGLRRWWRQTAIFLNSMLDDNHGFYIFLKLIKSDHY
jgi:hypothetical protein